MEDDSQKSDAPPGSLHPIVGRWIDVKESLPPDKEKVLVWAGAVYVGWRAKHRNGYQLWRMCCCGAHYSYGDKTKRQNGSVTHWMRVLPPNYQYTTAAGHDCRLQPKRPKNR